MTSQPQPKTNDAQVVASKVAASKAVEPKAINAKVLVCQNKTCKQQGSPQILSAFRRCVPKKVAVEASGCLGQCGNGPMVIVMKENTTQKNITERSTSEKNITEKSIAEKSITEKNTTEKNIADTEPRESSKEKSEENVREKTWYSHVTPTDVFGIAAKHFKPGTQSPQSLQPSNKNIFLWLWAIGFFLFFAACILLAVIAGGPSHYV
ncbi:MAG: (2Fe-2S) ferredoxin domain-containing protein [Cyanobacteria bacterium J06621_11]